MSTFRPYLSTLVKFWKAGSVSILLNLLSIFTFVIYFFGRKNFGSYDALANRSSTSTFLLYGCLSLAVSLGFMAWALGLFCLLGLGLAGDWFGVCCGFCMGLLF